MGWWGWFGLTVGIMGGVAGMVAAIIAAPFFGTLFSLFFIAVFGGVFIPIFKGFSDDNKLLETGIPAQATILDSWDTGITLNNSPKVGMLLEVKPKNKPKYQVKVSKFVSRLQTNYYNVGTQLSVRVDPNNPKKVAIESIG